MSRNKIAILLATHNGALFLPELLDSLLAQSFQDFVILARDDGSSDDTTRLLHEAGTRFEGRIELIEDARARLGPTQSFGSLLHTALADPRQFEAFMFCDQDDVWLPEKISRLCSCLGSATKSDSRIPLLAHADMRVVTDSLLPISASFWRSQRIDPTGGGLRQLLVRNCVTGHSCIINRALAEVSLPIPDEAFLHDWWLALVACATGHILVVDEALTLYRQHRSSVVGARRPLARRLLSAHHWRRRILRRSHYDAIYLQAERFLERFDARLPTESRRRLDAIKGITERGYIARRLKLLRSGVHPGNAWSYVDLLIKG